MALIKCPECGKDVSNQAVRCPKCGMPIAGRMKNEDYEEESWMPIVSIIGALMMIVATFLDYSPWDNMFFIVWGTALMILPIVFLLTGIFFMVIRIMELKKKETIIKTMIKGGILAGNVVLLIIYDICAKMIRSNHVMYVDDGDLTSKFKRIAGFYVFVLGLITSIVPVVVSYFRERE